MNLKLLFEIYGGLALLLLVIVLVVAGITGAFSNGSKINLDDYDEDELLEEELEEDEE